MSARSSSDCGLAKISKAMAVSSSKEVGWSILFRSIILWIFDFVSSNVFRSMLCPSRLMESVGSSKNGLVNLPTLYPELRKISASYAHTEPFPFVPATWMIGIRSWGFARHSSSRPIRSRPSLMAIFRFSEEHIPESDTHLITRFSHPYYFLRLLACFPALLYWLLVSIPSHSSSAQQIRFLWSSQLTLTIPLIAVPVFVFLRLRQVRKNFSLRALCLETLLDTWLVNFVAFNLGSLAYLGGWVPAITYLTCLICELLDLSPEKLQAEVLEASKPKSKEHFARKKWVIWPISESRKRAQVGFMDMEIILADLSLRFKDSEEEEVGFVILEMKNSNSLCATLKIWSDDDSAASPILPEVDDFVLLQYQAGREINRLPARQLYNDNGSDSEEELPVQDSHSSVTVIWSQQTILEAFKLK
ncbi:hypothetical protein PGTUg99_011679 [Puccinia graminis f. sp. tritici]|uniref:Uncharacterized protein n=1 Tax=Puccinia graminis f. sp. tritici TaxID=56615 RepID=A0A5B0Q162_PUCGR|nr:hypothetical protein PGTUg99_011679 [Puccinia graminis f. sp. tritici]